MKDMHMASGLFLRGIIFIKDYFKVYKHLVSCKNCACNTYVLKIFGVLELNNKKAENQRKKS